MSRNTTNDGKYDGNDYIKPKFYTSYASWKWF